MKLTKAQQTAIQEAVRDLRVLLSPGDTIDCVLRHVSRSGMSRSISLYHRGKDGPRDITYMVGLACGLKMDQRAGLRVDGCGMDMGFHVVYGLGRTLFPDGFGVKGKYGDNPYFRPDTKAIAELSVRHGAKYWGRNGDRSGWDDDGGYALRHNWL